MGESGAFDIFINYKWVGITAIGIFWAILFLQSGFDKVFDCKGNLDWLKGHFSKSPLASFVVPMLYEIQFYIALGLTLSTLSLIMLFFGQRIAKDYPGAQSIAIYFGIALLSFLFLLK